VGKAAGERLRQPLGVDPCVHGQARRLREDCHGASDHYLIAEFGGLARSNGSHMREAPRHRQNIGPHPQDIGRIATGHHRNGYLLAPVTALAIEALIADGNMPAVAHAFGLDRFGGPAIRHQETENAEMENAKTEYAELE